MVGGNRTGGFLCNGRCFIVLYGGSADKSIVKFVRAEQFCNLFFKIKYEADNKNIECLFIICYTKYKG